MGILSAENFVTCSGSSSGCSIFVKEVSDDAAWFSSPLSSRVRRLIWSLLFSALIFLFSSETFPMPETKFICSSDLLVTFSNFSTNPVSWSLSLDIPSMMASILMFKVLSCMVIEEDIQVARIGRLSVGMKLMLRKMVRLVVWLFGSLAVTWLQVFHLWVFLTFFFCIRDVSKLLGKFLDVILVLILFLIC